MAEKQVSVRLVARGDRQVKQALHGVGEAGRRGFARLSREIEKANRRLDRFNRRIARVTRFAAAAVVTAGAAMVRSSLRTIDAQAKLALSLGTTTKSIQVLARAGELAGVSVGEIDQATLQLTRRLSMAAAGTGPAVKALDRLNLSADDLAKLPVDEKIATIQAALAQFVPEAEQASVATQLFGDRAGLVFSRIDSATLRQATQDVQDFGVAVSENDASQIQRTNDALSRLGLIFRGIGNRVASAVAPALESFANGLASISRAGGPVDRAIQGLGAGLQRLKSYVTALVALMASRWVVILARAALSVKGLATALVVLRGALIRTGIGAIIVGLGELIFLFTKLSGAAGGFGEAFDLVGNVVREIGARIGEVLSGLGLMFQGLGLVIVEAFRSAFTWVKDAINDYITIPFSNAINKVIGIANSLGGSFDLVDVPTRSADSPGLLRSPGGIPEVTGGDLMAGGLSRMGAAVKTPLASVTAIRDLLKASKEAEAELDKTREAADGVADALDAAGEAGAGAGKKTADAAREAMTGWAGVQKSLKDYARSAADFGKGLGDTLSGAFQSAEAAFTQFIKSGKFNFKDFTLSIIADLATITLRTTVLSPLANAIAGAFAPRAYGGPTLAGVPYLVNEHTPNSEIFVPSQNGAVLNVQQAQKARLSNLLSGISAAR